jgi:AcrR family transcriptional regulator
MPTKAKTPSKRAASTPHSGVRGLTASDGERAPVREYGPEASGLAAALGDRGREQVADIQRARILGAAVEVVAEHGMANVSVAHIVARSGVSRRTFYELFADREDCFLAAFDDVIQRIATVVLPAYEAQSRWKEKIRGGLSALLAFFEDDRAAARLVIVDALGAGHNALERRERVLARVIAAVEEGRTSKSTDGELEGGEGPSPMAAEGIVGGVLAVLHSRLLGSPSPPTVSGPDGAGPCSPDASLLQLTGPLMSMIVLPYLGAAAARRELVRPTPERHVKPRVGSADPLRDLDMRLTYRTVRVLMAVAELGGAGSHPSNREVGATAGMTDQGQTSKLLSRLHRLGLIENTGVGPSKGAPNAWKLTPKGAEVQRALARQSTAQPVR